LRAAVLDDKLLFIMKFMAAAAGRRQGGDLFEMYRFGDASVVIFLASVTVVLSLAVRCSAQAVRGARGRAVRSAGVLAAFVIVYALALSALSLATPRQIIGPGDRHCFDDWCVGVGRRGLRGSDRPPVPALPKPAAVVRPAAADIG
jgi:hypothetical protein